MLSSLRIAVAKRNAATAMQLADLGRQTFHETFAATNEPDDMAAYLAATFSPEKQSAELSDLNTIFLLAQAQQEVVGYAKLHVGSALEPNKSTEKRLEIERLYVRAEWIGTGLGALLMRRALEEAKAQACRAVVLGVWEHNERALAFYQRFGFRKIGQHEFVLGTDVQTDLVLRKGF